MKKIFRIGLALVCVGIFTFALLGCDLLDDSGLSDSMLVGTWIQADDSRRFIFYSDGAYDEDTWDGSSWTSASYGDYTYNTLNQDLELDDVMNGNMVVYDIIMNTAATRMSLGVDALTGGDTSTLLGTWVGGFTVDSTTREVTWIFGSGGTISHTNLLGNTATGDLILDITMTEFEVENSTDTGVLANGGYQYIVIGDGITISEEGDTAVTSYYDKQ